MKRPRNKEAYLKGILLMHRSRYHKMEIHGYLRLVFLLQPQMYSVVLDCFKEEKGIDDYVNN